MLRWFETNGKESDVVISSRVRLARNVKKYNFSLKLTENDAVKMIDELSEAINSLDIVKDYSSYNFKTLDEYRNRLEGKTCYKQFSFRTEAGGGICFKR